MMGIRYFRNGPARALAFPLANGTDTSITVDSASGFPTQYPYTLILDPDQSTEEVVEATAAAGNVITLTRGVDGTTAVAHAAGAVVYHGVSARDPREANEHVNATENVHGTTGGLVDTDSEQTIAGKKIFADLETVGGGDVVTVGAAQTITGAKNFDVVPTTTPNGAVATLGGTQTFTGTKTFTNTVQTGTESHAGAETHTGTETHSGTVRVSNTVHQPVIAVDNTNVEVNTTNIFSPGTHPLGVSITAPPSGKLLVSVSSFFEQAFTDKAAYVGFAVRNGATIGSGTDVLAASSRRALLLSGTVTSGVQLRLEASRRYLITGLTAGNPYNIQVEFATDSGGNCTVNSREILVEPVL